MIAQKQAVCIATVIISVIFSEIGKYFVLSCTVKYPNFTLCRLSNQTFIGPKETFFNRGFPQNILTYLVYDV